MRLSFFSARKRPFHVDAQKHGAGFLLLVGSVFENAGQLFFRKGHGGRHKACHTTACLVSRYGLKSIFGGVTEIMAHAAVKVDIGEPGNGVEAGGIKSLESPAAGSEITLPFTAKSPFLKVFSGV